MWAANCSLWEFSMIPHTHRIEFGVCSVQIGSWFDGSVCEYDVARNSLCVWLNIALLSIVFQCYRCCCSSSVGEEDIWQIVVNCGVCVNRSQCAREYVASQLATLPLCFSRLSQALSLSPHLFSEEHMPACICFSGCCSTQTAEKHAQKS